MMRNSLPLWTPLTSVLIGLTWVLPNASPPWLAFHKDAWMAMVLLLVAGAFLSKNWSALEDFRIDLLSLAFVLVAFFIAFQWVLDIVEFRGHAYIGALYAMGAAMAVLMGRALETNVPGCVGRLLFPAFLLSAILTAGIVLAQWLRIDMSEVWVQATKVDGRPYGNLNQPNLAGSLLIWGLIALARYWWKSSIGMIGMLFAGAFLVLAIALTGSRTSYLMLILLLMGAGIYFVIVKRYWLIWVPVVLGIVWIFGIVVASSSDMLGHMETTLAIRPLDGSSSGIRLLVYKAFGHVVLGNPLFGIGFNGGSRAQLEAVALGYELPGLFAWSHNALLDLQLWFGVPIGLLIASLIVRALWMFIHPWQEQKIFYLLPVFVLALHSMLELPHSYAYFLLPAGMLVGAASIGRVGTYVRVRKKLMAFWLAALGFGFGVTVYDYLRVESSFYTWRFKQSRIGASHPMDVPDTLILDQFQALLLGLRSEELPPGSKDLASFDSAVRLFPSAAAIQHLAELYVKIGDGDRAEKTAAFGNAVVGLNTRHAMYARWRYLQTIDSRYRLVDWPRPEKRQNDYFD